MTSLGKKKIAVYCSSQSDLPDDIIKGAELIGRSIAASGAMLIYGGVNAGLMHIVAKGVAASGGEVCGVVPKIFKHRADEICNQIIETRDLNDRKQVMISQADAFIVLPGGIGTIDEWISTLSQILADERNDLSTHRQILVWNYKGMYDALIRAIKQSDDSIFGQKRNASRSLIFTSAESLSNALHNVCVASNNNTLL